MQVVFLSEIFQYQPVNDLLFDLTLKIWSVCKFNSVKFILSNFFGEWITLIALG